jgi:hypothetical protein
VRRPVQSEIRKDGHCRLDGAHDRRGSDGDGRVTVHGSLPCLTRAERVLYLHARGRGSWRVAARWRAWTAAMTRPSPFTLPDSKVLEGRITGEGTGGLLLLQLIIDKMFDPDDLRHGKRYDAITTSFFSPGRTNCAITFFGKELENVQANFRAACRSSWHAHSPSQVRSATTGQGQVRPWRRVHGSTPTYVRRQVKFGLDPRVVRLDDPQVIFSARNDGFRQIVPG